MLNFGTFILFPGFSSKMTQFLIVYMLTEDVVTLVYRLKCLIFYYHVHQLNIWNIGV